MFLGLSEFGALAEYILVEHACIGWLTKSGCKSRNRVWKFVKIKKFYYSSHHTLFNFRNFLFSDTLVNLIFGRRRRQFAGAVLLVQSVVLLAALLVFEFSKLSVVLVTVLFVTKEACEVVALLLDDNIFDAKSSVRELVVKWLFCLEFSAENKKKLETCYR